MLDLLLLMIVWWLLPAIAVAGSLARLTDLHKEEILILSTLYPIGFVIVVLEYVFKKARKE